MGFFFKQGVFDDYDYWAGTVSLVAFAFFEVILFSWVFGINKGWDELTRGADIKIPVAFKFIMKYVTPLLLGWVFISSLPDIYNNITHKDTYNREAFATSYYAEKIGGTTDEATVKEVTENQVVLGFTNTKVSFLKAENKKVETPFEDQIVYEFEEGQVPSVMVGQKIHAGDEIAIGEFTNKVFYKNIGRLMLLSLFGFICILVYKAFNKRTKEGRATA